MAMKTIIKEGVEDDGDEGKKDWRDLDVHMSISPHSKIELDFVKNAQKLRWDSWNPKFIIFMWIWIEYIRKCEAN